jgi:hypothetical protein
MKLSLSRAGAVREKIATFTRAQFVEQSLRRKLGNFEPVAEDLEHQGVIH